jgi:hypothetical protein
MAARYKGQAMSIFGKLLLSLSVLIPFIGNTVSAKPIQLRGKFSEATVKKDCDNANPGSYHSDSNTYGCFGKTGNAVICSHKTNTCTGYVYSRIPKRTLGGILRPPYAGNKLSGGTTPTKGHRHPVKVGVYKSHSKGMKQGNGNGHSVILRSSTSQHANNAHHSGGSKH